MKKIWTGNQHDAHEIMGAQRYICFLEMVVQAKKHDIFNFQWHMFKKQLSSQEFWLPCNQLESRQNIYHYESIEQRIINH
jgi:hypothetical protein